jgi:hypothetical protein
VRTAAESKGDAIKRRAAALNLLVTELASPDKIASKASPTTRGTEREINVDPMAPSETAINAVRVPRGDSRAAC